MSIQHNAVVGRSDVLKVNPMEIKIEKSWNPRSDFGDMDALKLSIIENGVQQPILIRKIMDDMYLVDGERRLRATLQAIKEGCEIASIPAVLSRRGISDSEAFLQSIIANDGKPLLPSEEAAAYKRLRAWGLSAEIIAKRVGKTSQHIYNRLKLVDAAPEVKQAVDTKKIGKVEARRIVQESNGNLQKQAEKLKKVQERKRMNEESDMPKKCMPRGRMFDTFEKVYGLPKTGTPVKDAFRKGIALGIYMVLHDMDEFTEAQDAFEKDGYKLS